MQSTVQQVTGVVLALLMLLTAALPAMAEPPAERGERQVCDEGSYGTKVEGATGDESGPWGSLDWDGDPGQLEATVVDGHEVELCVKGGKNAYEGSKLAEFTLTGDRVIHFGTQISHVAWRVRSADDTNGDDSGDDGDATNDDGGDNDEVGDTGDDETEPVDVDLQLTSICIATKGDASYHLYIGDGEFRDHLVTDGDGVMRVTNAGTQHSSVSFNVVATELGETLDDGIDAGEIEFYAVPAGQTIIVTDANGDTVTKAQNDYDCDLTTEGDPVTTPNNDDEQSATPSNPGAPSTPDEDGGDTDPVVDPTTEPQDRVGGEDRIATAIEVSQMTYPEGADVAFVARDDLFPDALAAGPLAALRRGPILLTDSTSLSAATATELERLDAADGDDDLRVVVLGGPAAVSENAFDSLEAAHGTNRIGGADRFHTAALIAETLDAESGVATVYVATGRDFPDAMVAGWASGLTDGAVLLAETDDISSYTADALQTLDEQKVYAIGGATVLSDDVVERLGATRVAGPDRYATTAEVATMVFDRVGAPDTIYLTTGGAFADTLTIAPTAILGGDGVLLVGAGLTDEVRTALAAWAPQRIMAVGGTAAVSGTVLAAAGTP